EPVQAGEEHQIFFGRQLVVDQRVMGDEADAPLDGACALFALQIFPGKGQRAGRWTDEQSSDLEQSGLARPAGAEPGDAFTGGDAQGNPAKSKARSVTLLNVQEFEGQTAGVL